MNITIRAAEKTDADALANLELECIDNPWSSASIAKLISDDSSFAYLCECDGVICGWCGAYIVIDEANIVGIAVLPSYRRRKIATQLLNAAEDAAKQLGAATITLEVRALNLPAIKLYEAENFKVVGCRRGYYSNPRDDAILMTKEL